MFLLFFMLRFPNAKINLGLHILRKRADGYHDIETCFYPVNCCDALEIVKAEKFQFDLTGLSVAGDAADNLCSKAFHLLQADFKLKPVHMHLHKVIPMGAGLGGGSADAAIALQMLNEIFDLGLNSHQLKSYADKLGSDCAFFIDNKPALGQGRGNELSAVDISLKGKYIFIVKPDVHVSTAAAYAGVTPAIPAISLTEVLKQPIHYWKENLVNDFEPSVFAQYPEIKKIKEQLYEGGALYASMSGSGAAVFGVFNEPPDVKPYSTHAQWLGKAMY